MPVGSHGCRRRPHSRAASGSARSHRVQLMAPAGRAALARVLAGVPVLSGQRRPVVLSGVFASTNMKSQSGSVLNEVQNDRFAVRSACGVSTVLVRRLYATSRDSASTCSFDPCAGRTAATDSAGQPPIAVELRVLRPVEHARRDQELPVPRPSPPWFFALPGRSAATQPVERAAGRPGHREVVLRRRPARPHPSADTPRGSTGRNRSTAGCTSRGQSSGDRRRRRCSGDPRVGYSTRSHWRPAFTPRTDTRPPSLTKSRTAMIVSQASASETPGVARYARDVVVAGLPDHRVVVAQHSERVRRRALHRVVVVDVVRRRRWPLSALV